jgi:hypothetical protein
MQCSAQAHLLKLPACIAHADGWRLLRKPGRQVGVITQAAAGQDLALKLDALRSELLQDDEMRSRCGVDTQIGMLV